MAFQQSLIFSRNQDNSALDIETIQRLAPAVFSSTKAPKLTDRYVSLHTADLIPVMRDYGYVPVQAAQRKSRAPKVIPNNSGIILEQSQNSLKIPESHNAHLVSFAHESNLELDLRPEIILYNSHDGTSSVQLYAGCYRFICSNGIVAGEGFNQRMYHSKSGMQGFEDMLKHTVESLPMVQERIAMLRDTKLDSEQQYQMARLGMSTRWNLLDEADRTVPLKGLYASENTIMSALRITRSADMYDDAFTVFNRIQETVIRGKAYLRSFTENNQSGDNIRKARPVVSAKESIRINSELWDACETVVNAM